MSGTTYAMIILAAMFLPAVFFYLMQSWCIKHQHPGGAEVARLGIAIGPMIAVALIFAELFGMI